MQQHRRRTSNLFRLRKKKPTNQAVEFTALTRSLAVLPASHLTSTQLPQEAMQLPHLAKECPLLQWWMLF